MDDYDDISDEDLMLAFEQTQDPSFAPAPDATTSNKSSVGPKNHRFILQICSYRIVSGACTK